MRAWALPHQSPSRGPHAWSPRTAQLPTRRVLVVDDLPDVLQLVRGLVRRLPSMRVHTDVEVSGSRAVELLAQQPFDLVLSDQRLGDVDGISVLDAARRLQPHARRILMTGYHDVPVPLGRVADARVDAYLPKPFPARDTLQLLEELLTPNPLTLSLLRSRARGLEAQAVVDGAPLSLDALRR